ncbi:AmmeMemoRadiSam system radical SAM enzyme [Candidatus Woesearchaeota archaeon]|jgi:pyruvate formate lyase activating enzyme|nr:AmmeMemoRadiSam system radical SAM enzyme [Candidatus Woesearchaeota archaeon]MBT5272019.1 AmmeMemoRadiSam system radical SAM enzyme [Candidatus Woesearchaeota archaeon]MBT6040760.1 AmmeMemoRadiSam system radical SAM enzyme [Candidatus Woesearchaeota archaeon]MBT6336712.1 AmmeMemoRadiSam system radical SAM enzyme [Candidatus Woesearchaeota archaeon]MBT7927345.1 AmmeMemoRadiSam system radical SAM enzyme [Candidatus Woesearchaeota archaeon]
MKECYLYEKKEGNVQCNACSQRCIVVEGKRGICGVRKNVKGKLYSLVYGKALGLAVDPIEKKPLFHFLPGSSVLSFGTVGCNFRCEFCQNYEMSQAAKELGEKGIIGEEISPEEIVNYAVKNNVECIAYTYNEPAVFLEFAHDTAKLAKEKGIKNIYVTNGYETKEALELMKPFIDAINIDLKSFNDEFYKKLCGARLQPVLDTIKLAHEMGFWLEITTLIIPEENDSEEELTKIAEFIVSLEKNEKGISGKNIPWHISRFFPMYKMQQTSITPEPKLREAYEIGKKVGLNFVYVGNIALDGKENTNCSKCNEILIKRVRYEIKENKINNGACPKCQTKINGVWK